MLRPKRTAPHRVDAVNQQDVGDGMEDKDEWLSFDPRRYRERFHREQSYSGQFWVAIGKKNLANEWFKLIDKHRALWQLQLGHPLFSMGFFGGVKP